MPAVGPRAATAPPPAGAPIHPAIASSRPPGSSASGTVLGAAGHTAPRRRLGVIGFVAHRRDRTRKRRDSAPKGTRERRIESRSYFAAASVTTRATRTSPFL